MLSEASARFSTGPGLDLTPRLLYGRSDEVDVLIESGVARRGHSPETARMRNAGHFGGLDMAVGQFFEPLEDCRFWPLAFSGFHFEYLCLTHSHMNPHAPDPQATLSGKITWGLLPICKGMLTSYDP